MNICVYGASSALLKNIYYEKTEELGRAMGKRGHGLVFGGGATGMMGAAARGVAAENGYILGIAPRFFDQPGVLYEKCTEFIFTENMRERKKLLEEKSDATIVAPGGIGTYEEFFEILTLKSLHRLDRPIVLYNINGYYDRMKALLSDYNAVPKKTLDDILDFHVRFERIHPFQDGNGRVGRLIMFKECLKYNIVPFIIEENLKLFYYRGLKEWYNEKGYLTDTCLTAQDKYKAYLDYFRIPYGLRT